MKIHASPQLQSVNPTGLSPSRHGFVFAILALASLALSSAAWAQSATESNSQEPCSAATLKGPYMGRSSGTVIGLPYTTLNLINFDGAGSASGSGTTVLNGVVSFPVITATYTVNSDCTGTIDSVPAGLSQNFTIKENGKQVFFVTIAHPAGPATVSGEAVKLNR